MKCEICVGPGVTAWVYHETGYKTALCSRCFSWLWDVADLINLMHYRGPYG